MAVKEVGKFFLRDQNDHIDMKKEMTRRGQRKFWSVAVSPWNTVNEHDITSVYHLRVITYVIAIINREIDPLSHG